MQKKRGSEMPTLPNVTSKPSSQTKSKIRGSTKKDVTNKTIISSHSMLSNMYQSGLKTH
jgi:hypothetical protein